ncbi:DUF1588 domain-containing protein [Pseudobacteriovorax antillogorgiicola]|uniref:DUF1592 domain-containing protein n=1 Tax=Pseudobacteriovorax antillogorgiicola TaxID=1513793 RepID=A0A1Y6C8M5_9BACT|nr:DUF1588 domain-containing protein [Pseudobacteriovorax antillogorgiicola]TCS49109.1 uncharacterized protein DUF1595 [Pseudobacteriovorax antillogorgiicola]SMF51632.1 Protein of unknown function [Pseudobacteriovorax antillogorgiicola]
MKLSILILSLSVVSCFQSRPKIHRDSDVIQVPEAKKGDASVQSIRLLSNQEYGKTVQALFNQEVSIDLENDRNGLFANQIVSMPVKKVEKYVDGAIGLVDQLDIKTIPHSECPDTNFESCLARFISEFGKLAWRRPLSSEESDRFIGYISANSGLSYESKIRDLTKIFLASPHFVLRTEIGSASESRFQLTPYEMASYLSYNLLGAPPHGELWSAAENGTLNSAEKMKEYALSIIDDPSYDGYVFSNFIGSMFQLDRLETASKDPKHNFNEDSIRSAKQELQEVFLFLVKHDTKPLQSIFTNRYTVNQAALLNLYGTTSPGQENLLEIDSSNREGFLSRVAFLAINSEFDHSNPMRRGAKILDNFMCRAVPPPPPEANEAVANGQNSREFRATSPTCKGCHLSIDPIGYAFESFNEVGQVNGDYQVLEESITLDGETVSFTGLTGPNGLSQALAASREVENCLIRRWYEYLQGSPVSGTFDGDKVTQFAEMLRAGESLKSVLIEMIADKEVIYRKRLAK